MKRYKIKEAFKLKSASNKLMRIGTYYATEDAAQIAELEKFRKDGSVEVIESLAKEKPGMKVTTQPKKANEKPEAPKTPDEDITVVPGVGKTLQQKLAELEITTVSQLKDRMNEEPVKELLGLHYEKAQKFFEQK